MAASALVGLGRRTITGMLCAGAQQEVDWSAAYRLFEKERFDLDALFAPARRGVVAELSRTEPVVAMMDDTLIRKRGRRMSGAGWKRDPLGPPFCNNFVWGQRFLQVSLALPEGMGACRARGIPIDLRHCPTPVKPRRRAPVEAWEEYHRLARTMRLGIVGTQRIKALRASLDAEGETERSLIVGVDGSFTNRTVFRDLPKNTQVIGRVRKDARLFRSPAPPSGPKRGRPSWYGELLPTPEQIRQDPSIPWQTVTAWGGGKVQQFEVKTISPVRWVGTGNRDARLVVVRPLAYRPRKGAHLLYRDPAYLLCSDPTIPLDRLLQSFVWRWEIELNFRDEKTVLGMGEAQVRTKTAVEAVPALIVAAYSFLLLAAQKSGGGKAALPPPRWRKLTPNDRDSTPRLQGAMRAELWGQALGLNKTHFDSDLDPATTLPKFTNSLSLAVCHAFR